jgi:AraC-like DNA-binding protein
VISGKGYFNGSPVTKGQGFLITPNMQEEYYPDKNEPWKFLWIISDDEKSAIVFNEFKADKSSKIFSFNYLDVIKSTRDFLKVLLTETFLSVTNIANSLGFEEVLSFSKAFKQKTGLSPQNYRNTHNKKT